MHGALALLLRAYPRSFRDHYGAELTHCVLDARAALGDIAPSQRMSFWGRALLDVARQGMRERITETGETSSALVSRVRVALGWLLVTGAALNVAYDIGSAQNSMGIFALLLTASSVIGGSILLRPAPPRRSC